MKLCDLGMAELTRYDKRFTPTGEGTPGYMPPEGEDHNNLMSSSEPSSKRRSQSLLLADAGCLTTEVRQRVEIEDLTKWDIFSLGILCWHLWTLKDPFADEPFGFSGSNIKRLVVAGSRPSFDGMATPAALRDIITRLWAQEPRDRPDARKAEAALGGVAASLAIGAGRSVSTPGRVLRCPDDESFQPHQ